MKESGMKRILRDERGMALALAIFALVVVGALVAGAFFAGTQEQRVGENWRRLQQSFGAAETGINEDPDVGSAAAQPHAPVSPGLHPGAAASLESGGGLRHAHPGPQ